MQSAKFVILAACLSALLVLSCQKEIVPPAIICGDGTCSQSELYTCMADCPQASLPQPNTNQEPLTEQDIIYYYRNRTRTAEQQPNFETSTNQSKEPLVDEKLEKESIQDYLPTKEFAVASRYNLLTLGENISSVMGVLTGLQMREVLGGGRITSNTQSFGPRAAYYEQFLTLRSGKVLFGTEEDSELISSYLQFDEGEPVFDYLLRLNGGMFKFFEGEQINLLGHIYTIVQVTNSTMKLEGVTTPDTIIFDSGRGVMLNDQTISQDTISVNFSREFLRFTLHSPDDVQMLPGESFAKQLRRREVLLTNRLDLTYEGLTDSPSFDTVLDKTTDKYKIKFTNNINLSYSVPIASLNPFKTGTADESLHFQEPQGGKDYKINEKDYFLIINNREFDGITNLIRLISVDHKNKLITFQDMALEKFLVAYQGTPGVDASANLMVYGVSHKVYVGPNASISVDMNGDGVVNGEKTPLVSAGGAAIMFNSASSEEISMSIVTPAELREGSNLDLEIRLKITREGVSVDKRDLKMYQDSKTDYLAGMSSYGTLFVIKGNEDKREQSGDDLLIRQPLWQRFANVAIKAYE